MCPALLEPVCHMEGNMKVIRRETDLQEVLCPNPSRLSQYEAGLRSLATELLVHETHSP